MFGYWKKHYLSLSEYSYKQAEQIASLQAELEELKSNTQSVSVGHTLTRASFNTFKSKLPNALVGDDSSAGAIGHKLGVALVLQKMEQELVVN